MYFCCGTFIYYVLRKLRIHKVTVALPPDPTLQRVLIELIADLRDPLDGDKGSLSQGKELGLSPEQEIDIWQKCLLVSELLLLKTSKVSFFLLCFKVLSRLLKMYF